MRIVSLNTWKNEGRYRRRLTLMAEGLAALRPDVVCLQECFASPTADTAAVLAGALGMSAYARPARRKLRRCGDELVDSTSGLAILARGAVSGQAACDLSADPRDGERIAQRLDLDLHGSRLRILNLHLTHLLGEAASRLRAAQLAEALAWARDGWDGALVVAGDLNARAEAPELAALAGCTPWRAPPTLIGGRAPARAGPAIDHCLLLQSGPWRVRRRFVALDTADADGWHASDHAAVVMDLAPRRSPVTGCASRRYLSPAATG